MLVHVSVNTGVNEPFVERR